MKIYFPEVLNANIHREENISTLCMELLIPSSLVYFQGHFNEMPVLPGIAQLDFVIHYAQTYLSVEKSRIENIKQMKFTSLIKPELLLKLKMTIKNKALEFKYFSEEKTYSTGSIGLKNINEGNHEFRS